MWAGIDITNTTLQLDAVVTKYGDHKYPEEVLSAKQSAYME